MPIHHCTIQFTRYLRDNQLYWATGKSLGYAYPFEIDIFNSIILGYAGIDELGYMSHTSHGEYHGYAYPSSRYKHIYLTRIWPDG